MGNCLAGAVGSATTVTVAGVAGFLAMASRKWPLKEAVRGFVVSILPGGTFLYDAAFLKGEYAAERAQAHMPPP